MDNAALADNIIDRAKSCDRFIVAIAGPPGAGKSTLAQQLQPKLASLGIASVIVPMDGFHLDNRILVERDLLPRKGAPATFDAIGFVNLIHRLRRPEDDVFFPLFDREKDLAIANAGVAGPSDRIMLVEGNYLLLNDKPWCDLSGLFDMTVFLKPDLAELERRLIARWLNQGLDEETARQRAMGNDVPNARTVLNNSRPADVVIS